MTFEEGEEEEEKAATTSEPNDLDGSKCVVIMCACHYLTISISVPAFLNLALSVCVCVCWPMLSIIIETSLRKSVSHSIPRFINQIQMKALFEASSSPYLEFLQFHLFHDAKIRAKKIVNWNIRLQFESDILNSVWREKNVFFLFQKINPTKFSYFYLRLNLLDIEVLRINQEIDISNRKVFKLEPGEAKKGRMKKIVHRARNSHAAIISNTYANKSIDKSHLVKSHSVCGCFLPLFLSLWHYIFGYKKFDRDLTQQQQQQEKIEKQKRKKTRHRNPSHSFGGSDDVCVHWNIHV